MIKHTRDTSQVAQCLVRSLSMCWSDLTRDARVWLRLYLFTLGPRSSFTVVADRKQRKKTYYRVVQTVSSGLFIPVWQYRRSRINAYTERIGTVNDTHRILAAVARRWPTDSRAHGSYKRILPPYMNSVQTLVSAEPNEFVPIECYLIALHHHFSCLG
jgi:hypothetical protein